MLAIERRENILEQLMQQGIVTISDLSAQFQVSEETIRRDLQKIENTNDISRVYGGAYVTKSVHNNIPVTIREGMYLEGKEIIAKLVSDLINDGETIFLDSSTTAIHIAEKLKKKQHLIVITNGIKVATTLADYDKIKVICIGGTLRTSQLSFVGPSSIKTLTSYYADKAFVSCTSVDITKGITDSNEQEAAVRQKMFEQSQHKYLIADNTKIGKTSFSLILPVDQIEYLVTDKDIGKERKDAFEQKNIKIIYPKENKE